MKQLRAILTRLAMLSNQRLMLGCLIVTAVYWMMFYDGGADLDAKLSTVNSALATEQSKAQEAERALKEVDLIRASVGSLNEKFKAAAHQLPSEIQNSEILKSVNTLAKSAGINIKQTEPKAAIRKDILEMIPLHVAGQGTFSEITMFFYYVSSMERIAKVANFTMIPPSTQEASKYRKGTLLFDGEVMSYRYIGDGSAAEVKP